MFSKVENSEILAAIRLHWKLQTGSYFDSIHDLGGASYNLGKEVSDYYWNYAGMINTTHDASKILIEKVIHFASQNDRQPAFFIDPSVAPSSFVDDLTDFGFVSEEDEIWMKFDSLTATNDSSELEIRPVDTQEEMMVFLDVFHEAYEMLEEGENTTPYGDSLLRAYSSSPTDVSILHFVGYVEAKPVSISSIYISGANAGIYNVGTSPKYTCKGYGGKISIHAIEKAQELGVNNIILQTELGGSAERLYKQIGFVQMFSGSIWSKS